MSTTKLPHSMLEGNAYADLPNQSTAVLDFEAGWTIGCLYGLSHNLTVSTANATYGRVYGLRIYDDGTSRTLTWPGSWRPLRALPTATTPGKWLVVTIEAVNAVGLLLLVDWQEEE